MMRLPIMLATTCAMMGFGALATEARAQTSTTTTTYYARSPVTLNRTTTAQSQAPARNTCRTMTSGYKLTGGALVIPAYNNVSIPRGTPVSTMMQTALNACNSAPDVETCELFVYDYGSGPLTMQYTGRKGATVDPLANSSTLTRYAVQCTP